MARRSKCINLRVQHKSQRRCHMQQLGFQFSAGNFKNVWKFALNLRNLLCACRKCNPLTANTLKVGQNSCQNKWIARNGKRQPLYEIYSHSHRYIFYMFFWLRVCVGQWSHKSKTESEVCGCFEKPKGRIADIDAPSSVRTHICTQMEWHLFGAIIE